MNASASAREGIATDTDKTESVLCEATSWFNTALMATKQGLIMMNTAYPIEQSGSNSSGRDSVSAGAVKETIGWLRDSVPCRFEGGVSLPAVKVNDVDGPIGREADCYIFGNPFVAGFMLCCLRWSSGPS
jgi:hypothetical protein